MADTTSSNVKTDIKDIGNCGRLLKIEVPVELVEKETKNAYSAIQKTASVHGFRIGKTPYPILKIRFGKALNEEIKEKLINQTYQDILKNHNLIPISEPKIDNISFEEGKPFTYEVSLEIKPEIKLAGYKGLKISAKPINVSDDDINNALKMRQEQNAEFVPVNRPAKVGDQTIIDFEIITDSAPSKKQTNAPYILGSKIFPEKVEEELVGAKIDDKKEVEVISNSLEKNIKTIYKITIKQIKEKKLLPINDEFAKELGDFKNLIELKDDIQKRLKSVAEDKQKADIKEQLLDMVSENSKMLIPAGLVDKQIDYMGTRSGEKDTDKSKWKEKYSKEAAKDVKKMLVLEEIAEKEKLGVSIEEAKQKLQNLAGDNKTAKLDSYTEYIQRQMKRQKILDFIYENAKIL
ncbi:trigger factor [bacterium]|nr:trigger factor [bacterium]